MSSAPAPDQFRQFVHAARWRRLVAFLIDAALLTGVTVGVDMALILLLESALTHADLMLVVQVMPLVLAWLYFAGMEASPTQGTVGKMALALKVTDITGKPASFLRTSVRLFTRLFSCCCVLGGSPILFAYFITRYEEGRQVFHDALAGTLVLDGRAAAVPLPDAAGQRPAAGPAEGIRPPR